MKSIKWILSLVVFTVLFFSSTLSYGAIPVSEKNALIALYNSTNGPGWTDSTNWNGASGTEGTWYGVTVFADQVVGILPELK